MLIATATLVILFLLKLRFPRNVPLSTVLQRRYGYLALQRFRKVEHASKHLVKKQLDLRFLKCCKVYNTIPKFLRFKLYRKSLHNSVLYRKWQGKLLDLEIRTKEKEVLGAEQNLYRWRENLKATVSRLDFICLKKFIYNKTEIYRKRVSVIHERKLCNIGGRYDLKSCDPDKVIFNYSKITLSSREQFLLPSV